MTLTAADVVVYYSNNYSWEARAQSEDRNHRIGQTKKVTYIDIVAELHNGRRTIDSDVLEILRSKSSLASHVSLALLQKMAVRTTGSAIAPEVEQKLEAELGAVTKNKNQSSEFEGFEEEIFG